LLEDERNPVPKPSLDLAVATLFLGIGVYGVYAASQLRMALGTQVGPGVFPLGATLVLAALALIHFVVELRRAAGVGTQTGGDAGVSTGVSPVAAAPGRSDRAVWRQLIVMVSLLLAVLLLRHVGYLITMTALVSVALVAFQERRPITIGLIAVGVALVSYALFSIALGVRMPAWPVL
jgi:hypothetical protein